jgi:hypothetical protein
MMAPVRVVLDLPWRKGVTLAAGVSLLACAGSDGGAREFVTAYCNLLLPCCSEEGLPASVNACVKFYDIFIGLPFDAAIAQSCLEKARNAAKESTFCTSPPLCDDAFILPNGTVPPGQPCVLGNQCAAPPGGQAICSLDTQTCTQLTRGQLGEQPCAGTVDSVTTTFNGLPGGPLHAFLCQISDGLYCDSNTRQCTALATTGQSCPPAPCVAGDYCGPLDPWNFNPGSCTPLLADGAPCLNTVECLPQSCCDPTTMTCNPRVAFGAACTVDDQCLTGNCTNGSCGPSAFLSLFCGP